MHTVASEVVLQDIQRDDPVSFPADVWHCALKLNSWAEPAEDGRSRARHGNWRRARQRWPRRKFGLSGSSLVQMHHVWLKTDSGLRTNDTDVTSALNTQYRTSAGKRLLLSSMQCHSIMPLYVRTLQSNIIYSRMLGNEGQHVLICVVLR